MKPLLILIIAASFAAPITYAGDRINDLNLPGTIQDHFPGPDPVVIDRDRRRSQRNKGSVRCQATDRNGYRYNGVARGTSKRSINQAVRAAVRTCKRQSRLPRTCRFLKRTCHQGRR